MAFFFQRPASARRTTVVAALMLLVTGFSLASPALVPHAEAEQAADLLGHGAPCSEDDHDGHPCQGGCCWLCCPRHAKACVPLFVTLTMEPAISPDGRPGPADLHPADVVRRVFHPPRA